MSQLRKNLDDLEENGQSGDWAFSDDTDHPQYIYIRIPDGVNERGSTTPWLLKEKPDPVIDDWQWDGNREAPTLTPSLHWVGVWHGWMRNGQLVPA